MADSELLAQTSISPDLVVQLGDSACDIGHQGCIDAALVDHPITPCLADHIDILGNVDGAGAALAVRVRIAEFQCLGGCALAWPQRSLYDYFTSKNKIVRTGSDSQVTKKSVKHSFNNPISFHASSPLPKHCQV